MDGSKSRNTNKSWDTSNSMDVSNSRDYSKIVGDSNSWCANNTRHVSRRMNTMPAKTTATAWTLTTARTGITMKPVTAKLPAIARRLQ